MKIYIGISYEEFYNEFCKHVNISHKNSPTVVLIATSMLPCEFFGGITPAQFWMQKIDPKIVHGVQRIFRGKLLETTEGILVEGSFEFHKFHKFHKWAYFAALLTVLLVILPLMGAKSIIYVWCTVCVTIPFISGIVFHRKEEREVIAYLKSLERKFPINYE